MAGDPSLRVVLQHGNRLFCELLAEQLMRDPVIAIVGIVVPRQELAELCVLRSPAVVVYEADARSYEHLVSLLRRADRQMRLVGLHEAPMADCVRPPNDNRSTLVSYASGLRNLLDVVKNPTPTGRQQTGISSLTERQKQVLHLIGAGYTPREVAGALGISQRTVENHKQQIFAKLDVHSQAHAVANAVRAGATAKLLPPKAEQLSLTPREHDILRCISSGRTTKQTAADLGISARTVENLQSNLFRKLRVHSRTAALVAAHDLHLIEV